MQKWAVLLQVSRTRRVGDGEVFTAERTNNLFVMWNEKRFYRLEWDRLSMRGKQRIWLVVRNTLLSCQFWSMSRKERSSNEMYGHFALKLNLYLFLNRKPSAVSRIPFLVKKFPKLLCQILKNRSAYRWRNTVCYVYLNHFSEIGVQIAWF